MNIGVLSYNEFSCKILYVCFLRQFFDKKEMMVNVSKGILDWFGYCNTEGKVYKEIHLFN